MAQPNAEGGGYGGHCRSGECACTAWMTGREKRERERERERQREDAESEELH